MTTTKVPVQDKLLPEIRHAFKAVFDTFFVDRGVEWVHMDRAEGEWKVSMRVRFRRAPAFVTAVVSGEEAIDALVGGVERAEEIQKELEAKGWRESENTDGL